MGIYMAICEKVENVYSPVENSSEVQATMAIRHLLINSGVLTPDDLSDGMFIIPASKLPKLDSALFSEIGNDEYNAFETNSFIDFCGLVQKGIRLNLPIVGC